MSSPAAKIDTPANANYVLTRADADNLVKGRRSFMYYKELGITEGTAGKLRCHQKSGALFIFRLRTPSASRTLQDPLQHFQGLFKCTASFLDKRSGGADL